MFGYQNGSGIAGLGGSTYHLRLTPRGAERTGEEAGLPASFSVRVGGISSSQSLSFCEWRIFLQTEPVWEWLLKDEGGDIQPIVLHNKGDLGAT